MSTNPRLKRFLAFWTDLAYLGLGMLTLCVLGVFVAYSLSFGVRWALNFLGNL
jgi:hypothetical protein